MTYPSLNAIISRKLFSNCMQNKNCMTHMLSIEKNLRMHDTNKSMLLRLLSYDVYLYGRQRDSLGSKVSDRMKLYPVQILSFNSAPYRYHPGVQVSGSYQSEDANVERIFAALPDCKQHDFLNWKKRESLKIRDFFDDDGAKYRMCNQRPTFDPVDRDLLPSLLPVFGFIDSGNCFCRSAQMTCIHPFLVL